VRPPQRRRTARAWSHERGQARRRPRAGPCRSYARLGLVLGVLPCLQVPERHDRCHGPTSPLTTRVGVSVPDLFQERPQRVTGFQGMDCGDRRTRLCQTIALMDTTDITLATMAIPPHPSRRGRAWPTQGADVPTRSRVCRDDVRQVPHGLDRWITLSMR